MDVQCEQRNCAKTIDLREEAIFCKRCQRYYCDPCYSKFHEDHDKDSDNEPNWIMALQR